MKRKVRRKLSSLFSKFLIFLSWAGLVLFLVFFPPSQWWIVGLFFLFFFLIVFLTVLAFFKNWHLGALPALLLTGLLLLQLFRQLHWLNFFLLLFLCLAIFLHWKKLDKI